MGVWVVDRRSVAVQTPPLRFPFFACSLISFLGTESRRLVRCSKRSYSELVEGCCPCFDGSAPLRVAAVGTLSDFLISPKVSYSSLSNWLIRPLVSLAAVAITFRSAPAIAALWTSSFRRRRAALDAA